MTKKIIEDSVERLETTIGDLIEAITQIAVESGKSELEGYELASVTIESILRRNMQEQRPLEQ
jgi:hypothetical protein